ncbi:Na+/H+ antiporter NhaA [Ruicaihuangia caeni]|uniref:Na+/H+ antiporter NhaA n=1 Tax=Ruicaihuangia caeni TaxID=3042517 RepID=UPI00338FCAE7
MERFNESLRIEQILRKETVGGVLLMIAAVVALLMANSGLADFYFGLRDIHVGILVGDWEWEISIGHLAADGLLAVFFFLVGLELKREFVSGDLRNPRAALVPIVAACGGVIAPALIFTLLNAGSHPEVMRGWAIPVATDIAFACAVLAVVGTWLPAAMRTFLLTLAVVDDLIGIAIIAVFYPSKFELGYFIAAIVGVAIYALIAQKNREFFRNRPTAAWLLLLPLGIAVWAMMYQSGIHATVAGVLLGFTIPVRLTRKERIGVETGAISLAFAERPSLAEVFEHRFRPVSTGIALPVFAFFSAGVAIGGFEGYVEALASPLTLGVILALVAGKAIGITGATWLITRLPGVKAGMKWIDVFSLAVLGGMGFTVSLLITELSFGISGVFADQAKIGVLTGSFAAAIIAAVLLGIRNRHYRAQREAESVDSDDNGVPDYFERDLRTGV